MSARVLPRLALSRFDCQGYPVVAEV